MPRLRGPHPFSNFSLEALEQMVAMGMVEGITQALGQLDAVLAD